MLLRIDDVVSGMKKKTDKPPGGATTEGPDQDTFGDARDG